MRAAASDLARVVRTYRSTHSARERVGLGLGAGERACKGFFRLVMEMPRVRPDRVPRRPRLTLQQQIRLTAMEAASAQPLTEAELVSLDAARQLVCLDAALQDASLLPGLRSPGWLDDIGDAVLADVRASRRPLTLACLKRAACGLGMRVRNWPEGIGVLLANDLETVGRQPPRLLTLGCDTEVLKWEGRRLEALFGEDATCGWAYDYALSKLREYQLRLLGNDAPSAPSVTELESQGLPVVDELDAYLAMRRSIVPHVLLRELVQQERATLDDASARLKFVYETCSSEIFQMIVTFASKWTPTDPTVVDAAAAEADAQQAQIQANATEAQQAAAFAATPDGVQYEAVPLEDEDDSDIESTFL